MMILPRASHVGFPYCRVDTCPLLHYHRPFDKMKLAYIASLLLVGLCCVAAAGAATEKDEPVDTAALDLARCMELLTAFDFSEPACFKKVRHARATAAVA